MADVVTIKCIKGSGYEYGISEMFKSYFKDNNFNFVNRIDRKTSGLVIGAKIPCETFEKRV